MKACNKCKCVKPPSGFGTGRKNCLSCTEYKRKWYISNRKKVYHNKRKWIEANPDKKREQSRKWNAANPHKRRQISKAVAVRRWGKLANAGIFVVSAKDLRNLSRNPCYVCGGVADQTDHVIPIAKGGRHSIGNLASVCRYCNQHKSSKFLIQVKARLSKRAA